jgi:hypothetical protein
MKIAKSCLEGKMVKLFDCADRSRPVRISMAWDHSSSEILTLHSDFFIPPFSLYFFLLKIFQVYFKNQDGVSRDTC